MDFLNMEDKTREALDEDGWLHSGNLGKIYFTSQEVIITAGGENVPRSPEKAVKKELPIISRTRAELVNAFNTKCCSNTETTEPTEELSMETVQATKVSDIIGGKDKEVYRVLQEGIC